MLPLALSVLLQARVALTDLSTAAEQSPRARECRGASPGEDGIWGRLRASDAQRYCELLARGYARLARTPEDALKSAELARALGGDTPTVRVLAGRAELALGHAPRAFELLSAAEAADARALADPKALHDFARAASITGQLAQATRGYRLLVSRSALFDDPRARTIASIEAAAHVLSAGAAGADEALGYLAQARQQPFGLTPYIQALRALAWQRAGRTERAVTLPRAEALSPFVLGGSIDVPLIPPAERAALLALVAAKRAPEKTAGKPR
jgi:hypothetical protein